MIFIWYRMNSSFYLLSIDPYVYTWTSCKIIAASMISLSSSLPFTISITHRAYSTFVGGDVPRGRSFWRRRHGWFRWVWFFEVLRYLEARSWLVGSYQFVLFWTVLFCSWGRWFVRWVSPILGPGGRGWSGWGRGYDVLEDCNGGEVLAVNSGYFLFLG